MNLTQIDAFCAVAETGSVSEAARQLHVNRSRLSMAIKALEQSLIRRTCEQANAGFNAEVWIARDDAIPDQLWQDWAHQLNKRYTATSFNLVLASSGDLANLVETQQVDFAFGVDYECIDDPRINYQPLGKIRMMSVCNSEHPLSRLRRVSDDQLRNAMQAVMVYLNEKRQSRAAAFLTPLYWLFEL
jgi:Transcriptional regulator